MPVVPAAAIAARDIADRFIVAGAVSPDAAKTLADLRLDRWPRHILPLKLMILRHNIVQVGEDKYYLDVEQWNDRAPMRLHNMIRDHLDKLVGDVDLPNTNYVPEDENDE